MARAAERAASVSAGEGRVLAGGWLGRSGRACPAATDVGVAGLAGDWAGWCDSGLFSGSASSGPGGKR